MFTHVNTTINTMLEARYQPSAMEKAIKYIEQGIKEAAKKGYDSASIYVDDLTSAERSDISKGLKSAGYSYHWLDIGTNTEHVYISWSIGR